jgi:hypothetical protein
MTDPFAALHGPRRAAPSGGAERAMTTGRRRIVRRRTAGAAAGVSVAVVAGVAVAARPQASDRLLPSGTVPTSSATTRANGTLPTPLPSVPVPVVPALPPGTPPPPPPSEPATSPTAPASSAAAARQWVGISGHDVRVTTTNDPAACTTQPETAQFTAQTGFCTILTGARSVTPGKPVELAVSLCRAGSAQARTVTFASRYETQLDVARSDATGEVEVWAWAHQDDFPADRHTVTFAPGDCRTWNVRWAGQGNDGYALPAGSYQVNGYPWGYDWTDENGTDPMGPPPAYYTVNVG